MLPLRKLSNFRLRLTKPKEVIRGCFATKGRSRDCSTNSTYDLKMTVKGADLKNYINYLEREYQQVCNQTDNKSRFRLMELKPIVTILNTRKEAVNNLNTLSELLSERDNELIKLAEEEKAVLESNLKVIDEQLFQALLGSGKDEAYDAIVLEVNSGVGGQEAMLFAKELFDMYCNFIQYKGWELEIADYTVTDIGGIRYGSGLVKGHQVFQYFRHEAGVHRVQRIPVTEKSGRTHTSTASVVALPQPSDIEISIQNKDLKIETKRASGAGGQHVNTTDSAIRIVHIPTGISVECQVDRSQIKNRQIAMTKLKTLLYQQELESQNAQSEATRKGQVRSNFRNEKIRTYNYPQDRISDHRLQENVHNIRGFFEGGEALETLIKKLDDIYRLEQLFKIVSNLRLNKQ